MKAAYTLQFTVKADWGCTHFKVSVREKKVKREKTRYDSPEYCVFVRGDIKISRAGG